MALSIDEIAAAINAVPGITAEALSALLGKSVILTQIEAKRAEIVRMQQQIDATLTDYQAQFVALNQQYNLDAGALNERQQATMTGLNEQMAILQGELADLVAQANEQL